MSSCVHVCMGASLCGGQRTVWGVTPSSGTAHFLFVIGSLVDLAGYGPSILPLMDYNRMSLHPLFTWVLASNSGHHICKIRTLPTESSQALRMDYFISVPDMDPGV